MLCVCVLQTTGWSTSRGPSTDDWTRPLAETLPPSWPSVAAPPQTLSVGRSHHPSVYLSIYLYVCEVLILQVIWTGSGDPEDAAPLFQSVLSPSGSLMTSGTSSRSPEQSTPLYSTCCSFVYLSIHPYLSIYLDVSVHMSIYQFISIIHRYI